MCSAAVNLPHLETSGSTVFIFTGAMQSASWGYPHQTGSETMPRPRARALKYTCWQSHACEARGAGKENVAQRANLPHDRVFKAELQASLTMFSDFSAGYALQLSTET